MVPLRKSTSQYATATTSKGKSTTAGGAGLTDAHSHYPDVLIEDVGEGHSSPPTGRRDQRIRNPAPH